MKGKRYYIGITADVLQRLRTHNNGGVRSTKAYRPWMLVHKEEFSDKTAVRRRELWLKKNYRARQDLFQQIEALSSSG